MLRTSTIFEAVAKTICTLVRTAAFPGLRNVRLVCATHTLGPRSCAVVRFVQGIWWPWAGVSLGCWAPSH